MTTVKQVLKHKGEQIFSVTPQTSILGALQMMEEKNVGAVLVMERNQVKGIFSERDYARRCAIAGRTHQTPVSEVMTRTIFYISPGDSMEACMAQMTDKHIRHLPVVESGEIVGVISIGDVVKEIIEKQKNLIEGLENYIMGTEATV